MLNDLEDQEEHAHP